MEAEKCVLCGVIIPEGQQVCPECIKKHGGIEELARLEEELRDIAGILSITANTDGNIKKSMEALLRIADRVERRRESEKQL